ncbi:MAG TPA: glutamine amidotransferase [Opitutaceae bacterium]
MFAALSFSAQNWLVPALAFVVVAAALVFWSYRAPGPAGPLRGVCLALKLLGLAALALCLLEPTWTGQRARPGSNFFAVLADNSQGLQIKDQGESTTRGEALQALVDPARSDWQATLADTFELRRYYFDGRLQPTRDFRELVFDGRSSAIGGALKTLGERFQGRPLGGVLLLTDGNATDLNGMIPDVTGLPPIYPVVIGRRGPARDLAVQQVQVSQSSFEDAPVTIQADVAAAGFTREPVTARLVDQDGRLIEERTLDGRADGQTLPFRFQLKPERPGLSFYRVEVGPQNAVPAVATSAGANAPATGPTEEATTVNNTRVVAVDRGQGPYRVLYVTGRPNWEFKFLNRAVSEDRELELVALIRVAKREPKFDFRGRAGETSNPLFRGFGNQAPEEVERYDQPVLVRLNTRDEFELRSGFPRTAEDLYGYHAVIIDDLEAEFFAPDQALLLQKFVSERGGGVLMLGGMESFQEGSYQRTPIGEMLPVYLDRPDEPLPANAVRWQMAREGWLQSWARLRDNEADERARIDTLPTFEVINRVRAVKPGASVIATAQDVEGAEVPALVVQRFGRGRTGALTIGDFWRWGMQDATARVDMDKAWRQTVRWLVSDVPSRVELSIEPEAGDANGAVRLQVRVRDEKFQAVDDATVAVDVTPVLAEGASGPIKLQAEASLTEAGLYEVTFVPRLTGGYRAAAVATNAVGAEVGRDEAGWSTDLAAEEFRSLTPNVALLEDLARRTGGEVIDADRLGEFVQSLPERKVPVMETWSYPLWHTPAMLAFALACLLTEWGLRRWKGLP